MLDTNLAHCESDQEFQDLINKHENVMLCCGRMGPMCLPVYDIMETVGPDYDAVKFSDMDFDGAAASNVRQLAEVQGFMGLPFTVYFKNGQVVEATSSIQDVDQVKSILDKHFK
ncbi:MAG: thioredoxin family protein [Deltaproteobacteria bacterium]|nr:thioredoxin family protein [Deltaproteobacteria bacterium]